MKNLLVLSLIIGATLSGYAQALNNSFELSYGRSFPVGAFGSTDTEARGAAFAENGEAYHFGFNSHLNTNFGVGVSTVVYRNALNERAYAALFSNEGQDATVTQANNFRTQAFFLNAFYLPLNANKYSIKFYTGIGLSSSVYPQIRMRINDEMSVMREKSSGLDIAYRLGFSLQGELYRNLYLQVSGSYFNYTANYSSGSQPMNVLSSTTGLLYRF